MTTTQHRLPNPSRKPTGAEQWEWAGLHGWGLRAGVLAVPFLSPASPWWLTAWTITTTAWASPTLAKASWRSIRAMLMLSWDGAPTMMGTGGLARPGAFPLLSYTPCELTVRIEGGSPCKWAISRTDDLRGSLRNKANCGEESQWRTFWAHIKAFRTRQLECASPHALIHRKANQSPCLCPFPLIPRAKMAGNCKVLCVHRENLGNIWAVQTQLQKVHKVPGAGMHKEDMILK